MELQEYRDKCEKRIGWALQELGRRPGSHELQSMARLIVDATTGPYRYFHTPDHLFMVAGEEDPVEVLAGLYHDLLYFQVDKSIFLNLASMVAGVVRQDGDHLVIHAEEMLKDDVCVQLVLAVFGFKPGETLQPFAGQNEFLSALAAMEQLRPYLSLADLARVTVCIELTIPFRQPPDESHPGAAEGLFSAYVRQTNSSRSA